MTSLTPHNGARPTGCAVVGVDLGGTKVRAALADLDGTVRCERVVQTDVAGGRHVVDQLAQLAADLAHGEGLALADVAAIAVGSPGVVHDGGRIRLAENIDGLAQIRLADELLAATGCAVVVENDANLAALGEQRRGAARRCRTFALLSLGTGVGLGIMVDGQLLRGARGAAGEIAFLPIGSDPADAEALRHGAFEVAVAKAGIEAAVRQGIAAGAVTALTPDASALEVFRAAADGDALAGEVVQREARLLAYAILAIGAMLDPELVLLAGGIGSDPVLLGPLRAELARIQRDPIRVAPSALGARAGVVGAVAAAIGHVGAQLSTTIEQEAGIDE